MKNFNTPAGANKDDIEAVMAAFNQFMDSVTAIRDEKMDGFAGRLNEDRHNRQVEQERLAFSLARLSPAASLSLVSAELAGTSLDLKNRFREQAIAYRQTYNAFMKEKTGMNVGGRVIMFKMDDEEGEAPTQIDPQELPVFQYRMASTAHLIGASITDMSILLLFNILFFVGAFVAFLRYDVR